ncbi:MAG TPA: glucose-1-phosphate thymidylyltransferase [Ktedonosporobacter sp.]|jgi:glucose-1-phosphate thymidylyltransferase|nr:glucose-1-phosphate thymidylyltransferase [Ktedonosporobacter sp.]
MKALILSGGKGTRLQPLTSTHAKQLVPIANKPVLFYVLETIVESGITDIGIIVGETHESIRAAVKDGKQFGPDVTITYIYQEQPLGLAHAVKIAQPFLQNDRFLMFLGDNFIQESIKDLVHQFSSPACSFQARVLLKQVPNPEIFGVAQLQTDDGQPFNAELHLHNDHVRIARLIEKPKEPVSNFAVVGIYFFDAHIFEAINAITPSRRGELEITDAIQYLIEHHYTVRPYIVCGPWIDTGNKEDMLNANRVVLSHLKRCIAPSASIDATSRVDGDVVLEDNVTLINSVVRGPAIIGRNATLANASIGPFTSLAHNCVVINSEIEHSIVLEECLIRDIDRCIEDSLIGSQTEILPYSAKPGTYSFLLGDHSHVGAL